MADFPIEQGLFHRPDEAQAILLGRSAGFGDDWVSEAEALMEAFGSRPGQLSCPAAVFAYPFLQQQVAVVQLGDQPGAAGQPGLGFHFLILPRKAYENFIADPFVVARSQPAPWTSRGALPTLSWAAAPLPPRSVQELQRVLQRIKASALPEDVDPQTVVLTAENAQSPALLGGVQVLIDGGRLVFERDQPDTDLLASLWLLLPYSTAGHLWPASFAFSNNLDFDVLVVARIGDEYPDYLREEQAADYPPGRYELALQTAVEAGDQAELDALLSRRSTADTWRLGIILLVFLSLLALLARLIRPVDRPPAPPVAVVRAHQAAAAAGNIAAADPWTTLAMIHHEAVVRAHKTAAAAGSIAAADPWTALGMVHHGNKLWLAQEKAP